MQSLAAYQKDVSMDKLTLTWRDVMDCKCKFGWRQDMAFAVAQAGYKFFVWEDGRVYQCHDFHGEDVTDTGLTVEDIK